MYHSDVSGEVGTKLKLLICEKCLKRVSASHSLVKCCTKSLTRII